ncbi:DUF6555 family protein [Pseudomonas sp. NPDC087358]|uniref:DUF6555 family protein n=1 Tax=Pseudomonas sp. NPDC087358 TaxID=3364439 RepID=UPI00384C6F59
MREDVEGPFKWQSIIALNHYEIHYVLRGMKKVLLHNAKGMTECDAWILAALDAGVPSSALPTTRFLTVLITAAQNQGISKVRWNLCPRSTRYMSYE